VAEEAEQRIRRRRRSGKPEQGEARREERRGGMASAERGDRDDGCRV